MAPRRQRVLIVTGTGLLLVLAIVANRLDWSWALRAPIWIAAIAGMVWTGLSKDSVKWDDPGPDSGGGED